MSKFKVYFLYVVAFVFGSMVIRHILLDEGKKYPMNIRERNER